jgi:adenylate cyclase
VLAATPQELVTTTLVVGFVDVVGYTSLARHVTDTELARLIERFESIAVEVVAAGGGRVVKALGDEVMFVADDPVGGSAIGLRLLDSIAADREVPDVRIGIAWGHVLKRFGDVYGPVVNIASRLTSAAKPGTVLVDRELSTVLAGEPTMRLRRGRPISVRGYSRLSPSRLTWAAP